MRHGHRVPIHTLPGTGQEVDWNCTLRYEEHPNTNPAAATTPLGRIYRKVRSPRERARGRRRAPHPARPASAAQEYMWGRNILRGNCMNGQLTQRGLDMHNALGQALRSRLVQDLNFLPAALDASQVWVRSTDVPRTVQSAHVRAAARRWRRR